MAVDATFFLDVAKKSLSISAPNAKSSKVLI